MGSSAHLVVLTSRTEPGGRSAVADGEELVDDAVAEIDRLERRWSRFRSDSEVSRLNAEAGRAVVVAPETVDLVERAVLAWHRTGGRFDPTVLPAVVAAGYDRSFDELRAAGVVPVEGTRTDLRAVTPGPASGASLAAHVRTDRRAGTVTLPRGGSLDLGGIGKGRAADLVVERLLTRGAAGACVNLGGDVRVAGGAPHPSGWAVAVADPFRPDEDLTVVVLADGAVATSARTRRQWVRDGVAGHHLIDPATGRPAAGGLAAVTVVAPTAAEAEVAAKAAFVAGREGAGDVVDVLGLAALVVADDGSLERVGGFEELEAS
jgi:thiamine biosynthesis lipoprotein